MDCAICLGEFIEAMMTPCGHSFCKSCLEHIPTQRQGQTFNDRVIPCPTCRHEFPFNGLRPNFELRRAVDLSQSGAIGGRAVAVDAAASTAPIDLISAVTTTASLDRVAALELIGAPRGLACVAAKEAELVGLRLFLLDNSGSTMAYDGHIQVLRAGVFGLEKSTRWEEICQLAEHQAQWNVAAGVVTEFHLLNPRVQGRPTEGIDWVRIDPGADLAEAGLKTLKSILEGTRPAGLTPLAERLGDIRGRFERYAEQLLTSSQQIFLVVVTDGTPTPQRWSQASSERQQVRDAKNRMITELRSISGGYPVSLVVRLCTDEDNVVDFWNKLDEEVEISLDVLDDLAGEAAEVAKAGNSFFVYSPFLHRFREGGSRNRLFDLLDETRLHPGQAAAVAGLLCSHPGDEQLPSYRDPQFLAEIATRIKRDHGSEWDPITKVVYFPPAFIERRSLLHYFFAKEGVMGCLSAAVSANLQLCCLAYTSSSAEL